MISTHPFSSSAHHCLLMSFDFHFIYSIQRPEINMGLQGERKPKGMCRNHFLSSIVTFTEFNDYIVRRGGMYLHCCQKCRWWIMNMLQVLLFKSLKFMWFMLSSVSCQNQMKKRRGKNEIATIPDLSAELSDFFYKFNRHYWSYLMVLFSHGQQVDLWITSVPSRSVCMHRSRVLLLFLNLLISSLGKSKCLSFEVNCWTCLFWIK